MRTPQEKKQRSIIVKTFIEIREESLVYGLTYCY